MNGLTLHTWHLAYILFRTNCHLLITITDRTENYIQRILCISLVQKFNGQQEVNSMTPRHRSRIANRGVLDLLHSHHDHFLSSIYQREWSCWKIVGTNSPDGIPSVNIDKYALYLADPEPSNFRCVVRISDPVCALLTMMAAPIAFIHRVVD